MVIPKIFSFGFRSMVTGDNHENETKTYCSEMILLCLLRLCAKNNVTKEEMGFINNECLKAILEYNFVKYPQTSETEKNKEMNRLIVAKDDI